MTAPKTALSADDVTPPGGANTYRCANPDCRHADVFHAFNTKNTVRKGCSMTTGPKATQCTCTAYVPELPESETS